MTKEMARQLIKQKRQAYNRSVPILVALSSSHSSFFNFGCFVGGLLCTGVVIVAGCATGMPASTSSEVTISSLL